jgi:hypothetical protein
MPERRSTVARGVPLGANRPIRSSVAQMRKALLGYTRELERMM